MNNVIIHPAVGPGSQKTEIDLLGVRFPHRQEEEMQDDQKFTKVNYPYIVMVEIKTKGSCLNPSWTDPKRGNAERFLRFIGPYPEADVPRIAKCLYADGCYEDTRAKISFVMVGDTAENEVKARWKKVLCFDWDAIGRFIHKRLTTTLSVKTDHRQWDATGQLLYSLADANRAEEDFLSAFRTRIGL